MNRTHVLDISNYEPIDSPGNATDNQRLVEIVLVTRNPGPPVELRNSSGRLWDYIKLCSGSLFPTQHRYVTGISQLRHHQQEVGKCPRPFWCRLHLCHRLPVPGKGQPEGMTRSHAHHPLAVDLILISSQWTSIPQDNRWAILNKTGSCLSFEGVPRNGVKMMGIPNLRFFEIIPAEDQEPGYYRYVELTPGDLPLLKIGLQHLLSTVQPVCNPVRCRQ